MTSEYVTFVFTNHNVIVLPLAGGFAASWELQKGTVSLCIRKTIRCCPINVDLTVIFFSFVFEDFGMPSIISEDIAIDIGGTLAVKFKMP